MRPKRKYGKTLTLYLRFEIIEKLRKISFHKRISMSEYVKNLIKNEKEN